MATIELGSANSIQWEGVPADCQHDSRLPSSTLYAVAWLEEAVTVVPEESLTASSSVATPIQRLQLLKLIFVIIKERKGGGGGSTSNGRAISMTTGAGGPTTTLPWSSCTQVPMSFRPTPCQPRYGSCTATRTREPTTTTEWWAVNPDFFGEALLPRPLEMAVPMVLLRKVTAVGRDCRPAGAEREENAADDQKRGDSG